jgi:hypothetical protein
MGKSNLYLLIRKEKKRLILTDEFFFLGLKAGEFQERFYTPLS